MGYTVYTKSLYRNGYRPMGETNPFAATHLGSTPFAPEFLHGYNSAFPPGDHAFGGQHSGKPFPQAGGFVLHQGFVHHVCPPANAPAPAPRTRRRGLGGLGDMVPDQSVITYQGTWQNDVITSPQNILLAVTQALTQDGFAVRNSQIATSGVASYLGLEESYQVTLQLQVTNGQGFADPNDIISVIRHEVYVASGYFPLADSIPTVQVPGASSPTATGQPNVAGAPPPPGMQSITDFLEQNAMWIGLGLAAMVLLPAVMHR